MIRLRLVRMGLGEADRAASDPRRWVELELIGITEGVLVREHWLRPTTKIMADLVGT
jgi:hypothetical protein